MPAAAMILVSAVVGFLAKAKETVDLLKPLLAAAKDALVSVKDVLEVALEIVVLLGMIKDLVRKIFTAVRDLFQMIWGDRQQQWEDITLRFWGQWAVCFTILWSFLQLILIKKQQSLFIISSFIINKLNKLN